MIDNLLSIIAPHYCYFCDKVGSILCDSCIKNIIEEVPPQCLVCLRPASRQLCCTCLESVDYCGAWFVGFREGVLEAIVNDCKFKRKKDAHKVLGDFFDVLLPQLPEDTVIIPIPTIPSHIRVRGYDHMGLVARYFAKKRSYSYKPILKRAHTLVQQGATASQRRIQAKSAFAIDNGVVFDLNCPLVIIDDVYTTGFTLTEAANQLINLGAKNVMIATILRQQLD